MIPAPFHSAQSLLRCGTALTAAALWLLVLLLPTAGFSAQDSSAPIITLAFSTEPMPPYYTVRSESGTIDGPWRRMLDTLFVEELGWQVNYILRPWQRAQNEVRLGSADGLVTIATGERLAYAVPVAPVFCCFPLHLFTWKDHPRRAEMNGIGSVPELAAMDLVLVANIGNGWYKNTIEKQGIETIWLPTDEQVLKFVALHRGDGLIDFPGSMANLAGKLGLTGQVVDTGVSFGRVDVQILIGKTSPFAGRVEEIGAALRRLQEDGTFERVLAPSPLGQVTDSVCCLCVCNEER